MRPTSMRMASYDRYGPADVLHEITGPLPRVRPGEVLIRVRALSVNSVELAMRAGRMRPFSGNRFPKRVGLDVVGEIVEAGTSRFEIGDLVWGIGGLPLLTAAEYVSMRGDHLGLVPDGLDAIQAAALSIGTTAITALRDKAALEPGERLLVRGATGGVGYVAVQLGKAMGAHVTALASSPNLDLARELGAHEAIDYRNSGELCQFDVIFDTVGTDLAAFRRLLAPRGRMVTISFDFDHPVRSLGYIAANSMRRSRWIRIFSGNPRTPLFAELGRWVSTGAIRPQVDRVFPLSDIAGAHRALENGGVRGKIVIEV